MENASFEFPKISGRTTVEKGGSPSLTEEKTSWSSFLGKYAGNDGKLISGMTDEIARTGRQSLFVDFENLKASGKQAKLTGDLVPIKAEQPYRISFWGRLDRERPLAMDERRPHLLVAIEYFTADQENQIGDTEFRAQMIPGSVVPGLGTRLLFSAGKWSEYYTEVKSPANAAFMKISFTFEIPKEEGETDGILYVDDAIIEGERGTTPVDEPAESMPVPEDSEDAAAAPAEQAPIPAAPPAKK